jgi:hypothetical protein
VTWIGFVVVLVGFWAVMFSLWWIVILSYSNEMYLITRPTRHPNLYYVASILIPSMFVGIIAVYGTIWIVELRP